MQLDETAKKAVRELGDAINSAVEKSVRVADAIENLREIGYEPHLNLKLEIGLQDIILTNQSRRIYRKSRTRINRRRRADTAPDENQILRNGIWFLVFGFWIFIKLNKKFQRPKTKYQKPFSAENHLNYFNYFTEIEETFIRRRGRNLLLSPLDWALIENWQEREIPLQIILRAIETVFDGVEKQPARKRSVKSLSYCKEEIEAQFAEWSEMQIGKGVPSSKFQVPSSDEEYNPSKDELFSAETIKNHLENIDSEMKSAKEKTSGDLRETFERVLSRLAELRKDTPTAEKLEESLEKLDTLIDESLLSSGDGAKISGLKKEIEKNLASYKTKMEAEVYQRTFDLMLTKRLREEAKIPRLSLFYL